MSASTLFAVITRGLEMILPLPSASNAESSSCSAPVSRLVTNSAMEPAAAAPPTAAAGRLTLKFWGVVVVMVPPPGGNKLGKSSSVPVWVTATPDWLMPIGLGPVLVLFCTNGRATLPSRTPRFFEKLSFASTMRASISTCCTGTSI